MEGWSRGEDKDWPVTPHALLGSSSRHLQGLQRLYKVIVSKYLILKMES